MKKQTTSPIKVQLSPLNSSSYYLNVPISFINSDKLSSKEAILLSKIMYLTNANKKYHSCFASCQTLAGWLGSTQSAVSFGVNCLEKEGYIKKSWIIDNITRGSKYMSTKHKMPTKAAYDLQKESAHYLKIPDDIVSLQMLNATDKIVYGALILLARHFKENISVRNITDILNFPKRNQLYRILRKLYRLELISKDNIPNALQAVLPALKKEHSYKPRGKQAPHYAPSLPGFGEAMPKESDELFIPFSSSIAISPKEVITPIKKKPAMEAVAARTMGFDEAMEAFVNGIPNIVRPYRERGNNFKTIMPHLQSLDNRYQTDINTKAFIKSHGIIIDMLHKKGFNLEEMPVEYLKNICSYFGQDAIMAEIPPISGQALKNTLAKLGIPSEVGGLENSLEEILSKQNNSLYLKIITEHIIEFNPLNGCLHNIHYREWDWERVNP